MPTFAVAFSGHRSNRLPSSESQLSKLSIKLQLELQRLHRLGYDTVYCGMAEGADRLCYEAVLSNNLFKSSIDKIQLHCVLPYAANEPSALTRCDANDDIPFSDKLTIISPTYRPGCFHQRNRFMVDNSDILLAVYDGNSKGGTAYTVEYARKQGKQVILINPYTLVQTILPGKKTCSKTPQT